MSQREVERTLGKLVTDEGFREEFFSDPAIASLHAGLELSQEELEALSRIPQRPLEALGACIDGRICRLYVRGGPAPDEPTG
ncbi:MAG: Franean1_4349 family RiPP [Candidatus Tectomicrobia bacterium]|uniref:Franean1_4349 family RiPP n=1 Tax=Tectimicrobiota bacterium TaxID=2528274 RepID=A0A932GP75_UNCTE|nr:Franean1_4349 family RiPP [Candidatus Tectomicrobia bacterium]